MSSTLCLGVSSIGEAHGAGRPPATKGPGVDLKVPGIILTVTGILAVIISLTKGPNLGLSRRTGVLIGVVMLLVGVVLLIYTAASQ